MALYFQKIKKHKIAIEALYEVVRKQPMHIRAFNAMGISYDHLGDHSQAIKAYQYALKLDPNFDYAHNNLGYSYLLNGNPDLAIEAFQKAISLNESNKLYHNNLGLAYAENEQFDLAIAQFSFDGDEITANRKLGKLFYQKGKFELSKKYFAKADQLDASSANITPVDTLPTKESIGSPLDSPTKDEEVTKSESLAIISDNDPQSLKAENILISKNFSSKNNKENALSKTDLEMRTIDSQKYSTEISKTSDQYEKKKEYMVNTELYDNNEYSKRTSSIVTEDRNNKHFLIDAEIEVSNGNGVNHMARRVGNYFEKKRINVSRLTNAEHFNFKETKIFYLRRYLHDAYIVAQHIPGWQNMKEVDELSRENIKIKVLIGKDLIPYHSLEDN
jgi:Flp pilus assembly protein TadD